MTYDQWFRSQQGISYECSYLFAEAAWYHQQKRINELEAELTRVTHNLTSTEQTMREYQELAANRLEEIAKYRDAPIAAYGVLEDQGSSVISWDAIAGWPEAAHEHINDAIQIWKDSGDFVPKYSVVPLIVKPREEK